LLWSLVYLVVRNLFALVWLLGRPRGSKELEILRFTETSATGKQFEVVIANRRIHSSNLKPYAFVF
jgi:hypothetical protein